MSNSLHNACKGLVQWLAISPSPTSAVTPLAQLASRLEQSGNSIERRPANDYDQIATHLRSELATGASLTNRQLKHAAWCLWSTTPALTENPEQVSALLRQFSNADSDRPFRTLATSFMASFASDMPSRLETADTLSTLSQKWGGPWGTLHQRFRLFDLEVGPQRLADAVIAQDKPAPEILKDAGLSAINAQSGYAKAVTRALLDRLSTERDIDHMTRLARIQRYAMTSEGKSIYDDLRPNLIEALLRPFLQQNINKAIRDAFLKVVLTLLGDPRLKPGNWAFVPNPLREIVQRWLTELSLRQFFDIVDLTANDRMWRDRRAFWESAFEKNLVDGAWVAFGPEGRQLAREAFGTTAEFATLASGRRQIESGHAVLLLRIGNGVVADWSHNGKCNIWSDASDPKAPKLFERSYEADRISIHKGPGNFETESLLSLMHVGKWQDRVAKRLHEMTGIRITRSDYGRP
ncbi:EH signature domain-containing protein [Kaistia sp. UC242_56]|uniref:EH signature domain-containing protein n=1 Tax=Kaistia sp. UC242_56 TaxID=3374625 RepID=UPI0037AE55F3